MTKHPFRSFSRQSLHGYVVQIKASMCEHWQHLAARIHRQHARTAAAATANQSPAVDAHDHAAMLVRWQHWLSWLEAQRLEVEQRIAARAVGTDGEEDSV